MNPTYIFPHQGLGDHILVNGLVRTIAKNYDKIFILCQNKYTENVQYMYRDNANIEIVGMEKKEMGNFIIMHPENNYIIPGHEKFRKILRAPNNILKFDEIFYKLVDIPIEKKWSEFYVKRDLQKEKEIFYELGLKEGDKYAFVHQKNISKIEKNAPTIKIIENDEKYLVFNYLYTIENAEEIHCVNSVFLALIDCIGIKKERMFLHKYARTCNFDDIFTLKSPWKIIQ